MQRHIASVASVLASSIPPTDPQQWRTSTNSNFLRRPARRSPCAAIKFRTTSVHTACAADAGPAGLAVNLPDLPATYKRLVARRCGASFRQVSVVQELPLQLPGPGEVLIRISHAGINGGCETFRARGERAFATNRSLQDFPLGAEGAGVVVALGPDVGGGGGAGLKVGQRVAVNGAAAFAEYVLSRPSLVVPLPDEVGCGEGAALVLSGVTACAALEATARVRPGEVVVVTAAAGGTGHLAVQLAAAAGATVVAIVGGPRKAEAVAALGAHHVLDRRRQDVAAELRRLFPSGVDVVYDGVGGELRNQLLACLGPAGRLLQVGYISEYPHTQEYRCWDGGDDGSSTSTSSSSSGGGGDDGSSSITSSSSSGGGGGDDAGNCSGTHTAAAGGETAAVAPPAATAATATTATTAASVGMTATTAAATSTAAAATELPLPSSAELFWGGVDVALSQDRRVIGRIWPKDLKSILRCRRRVFDLARRGQLRVLLDQGHDRKGVEGVADAIDYMLRGEHVGKVVIEIGQPATTTATTTTAA